MKKQEEDEEQEEEDDQDEEDEQEEEGGPERLFRVKSSAIPACPVYMEHATGRRTGLRNNRTSREAG